MGMLKVMFVVCVCAFFFSLGFVASNFYSDYRERIIVGLSPELDSASLNAPSDFFDKSDVFIFKDRIEIKGDALGLSDYGDTGSMLPFLDESANGITITPVTSDEILVGDIVSYISNEVIVVHRVVGKGSDAEGVYFYVKGDNSQDIEKIRFEQIKRKIVGVLY